MKSIKSKETFIPLNVINRCKDFDKDCIDVKDYLFCYMFEPDRGYCPYVQTLN